MTRRDSPLLAQGIFLSQEKDSDSEWWSEKGERGEGDHVCVREILRTTEEKSVAREREKRYEKRGEEKKERVQKREDKMEKEKEKEKEKKKGEEAK